MNPARASECQAPAQPHRWRQHSGAAALGRHGEDAAAAHLTRLGCRVLARNLRTRHGEIDLIALGGDTIVFVEVKTRRCNIRGAVAVEPLAGLRARQRIRLRRLAAAWLADPATDRPVARDIRFDAIGVVLDAADRLLRLDHIEGAW